jgi:hypothetical protein
MHKLEGEASEYKSVQREVEESRLWNRRWMVIVGGYSPNTEVVGCSLFRLLFVIKAPDKVLTWTWTLAIDKNKVLRR